MTQGQAEAEYGMVVDDEEQRGDPVLVFEDAGNCEAFIVLMQPEAEAYLLLELSDHLRALYREAQAKPSLEERERAAVSSSATDPSWRTDYS